MSCAEGFVFVHHPNQGKKHGLASLQKLDIARNGIQSMTYKNDLVNVLGANEISNMHCTLHKGDTFDKVTKANGR